MCNDGNKTSFRSTKDFFVIFFVPGDKLILGDHVFCIQCLSRARLSHSHKKQGNFVNTNCYLKRIVRIFKLPHICHLCSLYLIFLITKSKFWYSSLNVTEWATGMKAYVLPLFMKHTLMLHAGKTGHSRWKVESHTNYKETNSLYRLTLLLKINCLLYTYIVKSRGTQSFYFCVTESVSDRWTSSPKWYKWWLARWTLIAQY